jgi:hypothetical protein
MCLANEVNTHDGSIFQTATDGVYTMLGSSVALVLPIASLGSVNKTVELCMVTLECPTRAVVFPTWLVNLYVQSKDLVLILTRRAITNTPRGTWSWLNATKVHHRTVKTGLVAAATACESTTLITRLWLNTLELDICVIKKQFCECCKKCSLFELICSHVFKILFG